MKKLALIPLLLALAFLSGLVWFFVNVSPPNSNNKNSIDFVVLEGSTATQIGSALYQKGLIKNPIAFKIYIQFTGLSGGIQAGSYRLSQSFNLFQIADLLSKSPPEVRVTIPEGLRREEIAVRFAGSLNRGSDFINSFLTLTSGDEGYLFPDTYLISENATPQVIISKMKANSSLKTDSLTQTGSSLTKTQLIVLASLIERETRSGDERPIVAGILINRLNAGMPLQVDATVQYALATAKCKNSISNCSWWGQVSPADLQYDSVFNTYKNVGLPPNPISNPGLSSIKAAYNPSKTDYFYYIHDTNGQIHYAKTLDEQNANIQKYLN